MRRHRHTTTAECMYNNNYKVITIEQIFNCIVYPLIFISNSKSGLLSDWNRCMSVIYIFFFIRQCAHSKNFIRTSF